MTHPIEFVENFLATQPAIRQVELSRYRYYPQSLVDVSITNAVPATLLRQEYERCLAQLGPEEEIAINSRVWSGTSRHPQEQHMPLVDFISRDQRRAEDATEQLMSELDASSAALCQSGRSFHLYLGVLISPVAWSKFMGRLLLLNLRGGPEVIDARWVGHRIMGGYAALRWSANSVLHTQPPSLVREW